MIAADCQDMAAGGRERGTEFGQRWQCPSEAEHVPSEDDHGRACACTAVTTRSSKRPSFPKCVSVMWAIVSPSRRRGSPRTGTDTTWTARAYVSKPPPLAPRGGSPAAEHAAALTSARNRLRDRDDEEKQDLGDIRGIAEESSSSDCTRCTAGKEV